MNKYVVKFKEYTTPIIVRGDFRSFSELTDAIKKLGFKCFCSDCNGELAKVENILDITSSKEVACY